MRRFIIDDKSFLCAVDAAKRSLKYRGWGLVIVNDGDNWIILNVVNGYWCTVIEKVGTIGIVGCDYKTGYLIEIDDDLEDELRYLCMRDAGEVLKEGIKNYLEDMNNELIKLKEV